MSPTQSEAPRAPGDPVGARVARSGRAAEAIPVARRGLAIAPSSPDLLYHMACAHAQLGDGEAAAAALQRAIALDPDQLEDARDDSDFDAVRDTAAMGALFH